MPKAKYHKLFEPLKIGNLQLKNKVMYAAMFPAGYCDSEEISDNNAIEYYVERAKGGVGLICTGTLEGITQFKGYGPIHTPFDMKNGNLYRQYSKMLNRIHTYGTKMFASIGYCYTRSFFADFYPGTPIAPSPCPNLWNPNVMHREITTEEVEQMVKDVGTMAAYCKFLGFDGVELMAYGSYTIDTFLTKEFNQRTDKYGGKTIRERATILVEMIKSIKEACGKNFPLQVKITTKHHIKGVGKGALAGEKYTEFGRDVAEGIELAKIVEEAGADSIWLANGCYDALYWQYPPVYQPDGLWLNDFRGVKEAVHIPVVGGGKILNPDMAEDILESGILDAVGIGRALIADPDWVNKAHEGKAEDIRPCIGCNRGCINNCFKGLPFTCAVNPDVCLEINARYVPVKKPKKIVVIGGGIAGMQFSRIAAARGHKVSLYEKNGFLGGAFQSTTIMKFKDADEKLIAWLERDMKKAGVDIHLNTALTVDEVINMDCDEIVVATGAAPKILPIPGHAQNNVYSAIDALRTDPAKFGNRIVVIGGGEVGCEVAIWLAGQEHKSSVTLLEVAPELMSGPAKPFIGNEMMLKDMLSYNHVDIKLNTMCTAIDGNKLTLTTNGKESVIEADTVIMSVGYKADYTQFGEISSSVNKIVHLLGDAEGPANVLTAMRSAKGIADFI